MRYFLDTEFIEGFKKPLLGKRRHFIDLISIGIVAEDGREYYAISNEFNYRDADMWVLENVILKLPLKLMEKEAFSDFNKRCKIKESDNIINWQTGKSNEAIAAEIKEFCKSGSWNDFTQFGGSVNMSQLNSRTAPEFYAYYADYDWVLFCSLFGRMIDLPKGFPMYCIDLKQTLDEKAAIIGNNQKRQWSKEYALEYVKNHKKYPKQENEHDALADAKWNKALYEFLKTL